VGFGEDQSRFVQKKARAKWDLGRIRVDSFKKKQEPSGIWGGSEELIDRRMRTGCEIPPISG